MMRRHGQHLAQPRRPRLAALNLGLGQRAEVEFVDVLVVVELAQPVRLRILLRHPRLDGVLRPGVEHRVVVHREQLTRRTGAQHRAVVAGQHRHVGRAVGQRRAVHLGLARVHAVALPNLPSRVIVRRADRAVADHRQVLRERIPHQRQHVLDRQARQLLDLVARALGHLGDAAQPLRVLVDAVEPRQLGELQLPQIGDELADLALVQSVVGPLEIVEVVVDGVDRLVVHRGRDCGRHRAPSHTNIAPPPLRAAGRRVSAAPSSARVTATSG
ncbi:hypothetical protein Henu3_gp97 [Mycobacterium phage Henu3]|uniref:Uncharacterized protein n=1 Tax=Mycobacterium phage Henu3 TaxID=2492961 RepID=A0A410T887_9CAUD|nr:hypothetical protein I5G68_gp81 [Mycobacterium phage Henu3]QAU05025.1 hypothetical protein Henu3_gp97 [Mycobacterium phage Henu3]